MGMESIAGITRPAEWIKEELNTSRIVRQRIIGNVAYMAYRSQDGNNIFGLVIEFTRRTYRGKTIELWGKIMDENMGPYAYRCPRNILETLTPTKNRYALKWRAENWKQYGITIDWVSMLDEDDKKAVMLEREEDRMRLDEDPDLIVSAIDWYAGTVKVTTADGKEHYVTEESYKRVFKGRWKYENKILLSLCEIVEVEARQ